jgi:hypothetical protein
MRNRQREKRPKQLRMGCMQVEKTRHETPSYMRALVAARIVDAKTSIDTAWGIWTTVCLDAEFVRACMALEKSQRNFLPSVAAPFSNGVHVLKSMSEKQIAGLRERIGMKRETAA